MQPLMYFISTESEAPLSLTAVPTNTTVTVSWMAPQDPNGIIFTYSVILLDESSLEVDRMNTSGGMLSVEFSDLDPFSNYTVSVRALTGESGEFVGESATTSFMTEIGSMSEILRGDTACISIGVNACPIVAFGFVLCISTNVHLCT